MVVLQLGDIIKIISPGHDELHEQTFFIDYIDSEKIKLINVEILPGMTALRKHMLRIKDGTIADESIRQIILLDRSSEEGYARQNGLLPETWLDIYFSGEVPTIITCKITNLEEDMIELLTYPARDALYIDFEYKGIPENIPISKIVIREAPSTIGVEAADNFVIPATEPINKSAILETETAEEISEKKTQLEHKKEDIQPTTEDEIDVRKEVRKLYVSGHDIIFGEELGAFVEEVEVQRGQERYGLETQLRDFMNELLANIPLHKRDRELLNDTHKTVERFKLLRENYSIFDKNGIISGMKQNGAEHKPIIEHIEKMDKKLKWILPIVPLEKFSKKLYWDETGEDVTGADRKNIDEILQEEKNKLDQVYYNAQNPFQNKYVDFLKNVYPAPFNPIEGGVSVETDIEAIVEGAPVIEYYGKGQILRAKKWFIQTYNTGYTHLYEEIPKKFIRKSATPNDDISVQSVIILPEPVVRFSRIDLPTTDIMTRASLNDGYFALWRALRANTTIKQKTVTLEDNDVAAEKERQEKKEMGGAEEPTEEELDFLSVIKKYDFDVAAAGAAAEADNISTTGAYLQKIIPRTKFLFKKIQKYIRGKYSFIDVVKYMEPFMIYPSDITFRQYNVIRRFLQQKIKEKKQERADNAKKYGAMSVAFKSANSQYINTIYDLFLDATKQDMLEVLIKIYFPHFGDIKQSELLKNGSAAATTPAEIISRIIEEDGAALFTITLANMTLGLTSHEDIIKSVEQFHLKDVADLEKMRPEDREKCIMRKIAKKYGNPKDLEKDNGKKDVYYDKEYDTTPYNILETPDVRSKRKELSPEKFKEYLAVVLVEKYGFEKENIERKAEEMIHGKKTIEDGVYAVLSYYIGETGNGTVIPEYYRREGANWVKDTTIDENTFIDNNVDMCNISPDCAATKPASECHTPKVTAAEIRKNARKKMMSEFDETYKNTIEESRKTFAELIKKSTDNLERVKILRELNARRANEFAVWLGKNLSLGGNGENNPIAVLQSPYYILLEWIFAQTDHVKKQYDILKFYDKYCREPFGDEEKGWLFCKKTNTKLLPVALYRLADAFVRCGNAIERVVTEAGEKQVINNSFMIELGKICAEFGTLSEDGDAIVDKYSGRVLRKIDFSTDEGYDENGFKITTHEVLAEIATMEQKFLAAAAAAATVAVASTAAGAPPPQKKTRFTIKENEVTQMVYNVARTLCSNIYVPFDNIEEFVLHNVISILEKNVLYLYEKDEYNEKLKSTLKKPFEVYRNQYIIWTTAAMIILAVQCAIPSIKIKKTFPQCIMSFDGYPFYGEGDMSALEYMACVINKTKSSISPWNSMMKNTDHDLKMKHLLERMIMTDENIQISIKKKQEYSMTEEALRETEFMPEIHRIQKWVHFYPPLVPISLTQIRGVGAEFLKEMERTIRAGHKEQRKQFGILRGKLKEFSFGIIQSINHIVEKNIPLLKTATQVPFMENACCSSTGVSTHNVLAYFVEKDDDIMTYEKNILKVSEILRDINEMKKSPFLFDSRDTRTSYPPVNSNFNTPELIYDTIIHYCRYGLDAPTPHEFLPICPTKYEGYKRSWNTAEKIAFFADHGKKYDYDDMKKLLHIVDAKNIVNIKPKIHIDKRIENFSLLLEQDIFTFLQGNGAMLQKKISDYVDAVISTPPSKSVVDTQLKNLHRYLEDIVSFDKKSMADYIMNFLINRINAKDKTKIRTFMNELESWKTDELMKNNANFYKNGIVFMAKVAPKFLLLGKYNENATIVHEHWDLESGHRNMVYDIIIASNLKNGYSIEKRIIDGVLTEILRIFEKVDLFIKSIDFFDINTRIKIYKYLWFRVIYEYINATLSQKFINKTARYDEAIEAAIEEEDLQIGDDISAKEIENRSYAAADTTIIKMEENVYNILMRFFSHFTADKQNLNKSYDDIFGGAIRAKNKEKEEMKAMFERMNHDERKVEKTLMEIGMGKWKKGKSKSVFKYDKDAYREDSEYFNQQMQNEKITGVFDAVTRERVGFGMMAAEEILAAAAAAEEANTEMPADAAAVEEWNFDELSERAKPVDEFEGRGDIDIMDIPADGDEVDNSLDDDYNVFM